MAASDPSIRDDRRSRIEDAISGVERLQRAYLPERLVFLTGSLAAIVLLVAITVMMISSGDVREVNWAPLFGSGGLFLTTSAGSMVYFNKSFEMLRELAGGKGGSSP
jgi:hypothetical protein